MSRVRRIHAQPQLTFTPAVANTVRSGKLRVAAYARVSTTMDQQANSFQAQKEYYERLIEKTQGWSFAGIYADHGISGTSADHRDGFQKMMEDCRAGLIDRILTKSISRFARNTVDSLNAIRELKAIGIGILFEKENIFTLDSRGEFLITVMSSLAQEESRSISENIRWAMKKKMADGKYSVVYSHFLGYDNGFVINQNEAKIVRFIFRSYIQGYSDTAIVKRLMELGVPAPYGGRRWHPTVVIYMLQNEKYKGDALLQKTFTSDFLSKKQKNRGGVPQYFVSGGHDPIIDPELFDYVQEERQSRKEQIFTGMHPWSSKMVCGKCGRPFRIKTRHGHDCWECRDSYKKKDPCKGAFIYEEARRVLVNELMVEALERRPGVLDKLKEIVDKAVSNPERKRKIYRELDGLSNAGDYLSDDEDLLLVVRRILLFPDNHIEAELVGGEMISKRMRPYSPGKGYRTSQQDPTNSDV